VIGSPQRRGISRLPTIAIPIAGATLILAGCGGNHNVLHAESHAEHRISLLFWIMMIGSFVALGVVAVFLLLGWVRRHREGLPGGGGEKTGAALVVVLGVAVPIVVLSVLFWYSDVEVIDSTTPPAAASTSLTVEVTGHQWFWEVRYPGTSAVTANEIHIPVHTRVNLVAKTADVIHSFWVPELNRKIDMIPGRSNRILLDVDRVGVYRGQCSEFCGLQHAHMAMLVFADPPDVFRRWLAHMAQPAAAPPTAADRRGRDVFLSQACSGCHAIRGTKAEGTVGPDLTHLQTRTTLAADTIPNSKSDLGNWVLDPQHVKPGNKMPALPLAGAQFQDLLAYLESLR
jgi:cytochrome c oxidase subunit II